jgi:sulfur carrier protein
MTKTIQLNGKTTAIEAATVIALIEELNIKGAPRGIAVAVNGAVVPRASWPARNLAAGDEIEIVRAAQGG